MEDSVTQIDLKSRIATIQNVQVNMTKENTHLSTMLNKALAIAIRTIAIAIAIVAKKAIEYCNMQ